MLNEVGHEIGVQNGIYLFGEDWVKSVGTRFDRLSPWRYLDLERTYGTFTIVQFGGREDVRVGGKGCGEGVSGSGISTSGVQREIYPTNVRGNSAPEAKITFALAVLEV